MNDNGWIKLHRKMREWQHYQNPSVRMVFEDLLFAVNSKARFFHGKQINRGETMISISSLEYNTGLSRRTVIKALKILEDTGEIKREKYANGVKTIICNYCFYQGDSKESSVIDTPLSKLPSTPPGIPEQEDKNGENKKKKKENISLSNESVSGEQSPDQPDQSAKVDFVGLITFFNNTMNEAKAIIPRIVSINGKREGNVRARIREYGLEKVYEMITKASQSDFLNGKNRKGWRADFSWLFLPTNFQKVLEGNYDNGQANATETTQSNYYHTGDEGRDQRAADYAQRIARLAAEDDARAAALWKP